jgi:UDP-N-acetylmuramyl pentapeptide phosphotransferase/UDP-N-acetylglucosamine-1-phosphate transferase
MVFYALYENCVMKALGIILIVVGIAMFVFNGFNVQTKKKVVDVGPIEVNKKEDHKVSWPPIAGGIAIVAGVALVIAGRKK